MLDDKNSVILKNAEELETVLSTTIASQASKIALAADLMVDTFKSSNKVLVCGNGGSAADSQHFAAELVSSFQNGLNRKALPVIALTTDTSILTAYANDFGFENLFVRQLEALGSINDLLIVFTTSGKSVNCLNALRFARSNGIKSICFTRKNSMAVEIADLSIEVESTDTQRIQEVHQFVYHTICELIESEFVEREKKEI